VKTRPVLGVRIGLLEAPAQVPATPEMYHRVGHNAALRDLIIAADDPGATSSSASQRAITSPFVGLTTVVSGDPTFVAMESHRMTNIKLAGRLDDGPAR